MPKKPMSNVDAAWLHMEDPTNLMMIAGFFEFDQVLDYARVKATLEHRLLRFRRFRQRVVESRLPMRGPFWEDDPHFQLEAHLHRIALPAPHDEAALRELVNDLASTPLDYKKPLWQIHIIEGYGERSLMFCRLHHCIADGIALMHVMLSLCDESADAPWPEPQSAQHRSGQRGPLDLLKPAGEMLGITRKMTGLALSEGRQTLARPSHLRERGELAASYGRSLARLLLLPPDPKTAFKGELGVSKRTAWSGGLPLNEVKWVGKTVGATINDVLMALVSGALRRYLLARGEQVDGLDVRAMVPVNLRPAEQAFRLGNEFGLVVMALPIGIAEPLERLVMVKRRMDQLKNSPEAVVGYSIVHAMGMAPMEIEGLGVSFFASKASMVLTNVPGPREKLYFAGQAIDKIMFWVPQSGRVSLGISIFSYAGEVMVGVFTDAGLIPDPEVIVAALQTEFEEMKALVRLVEASTYHGPVVFGNGRESPRCAAVTESGDLCPNTAVAGSAYCHTHAELVADSDDMRRDDMRRL